MQASWLTPKERPCSAEDLAAEGIQHEKLDLRNFDASVDRVKRARDLARDEVILLSLDNPNHEGAIAKEADEHAHLGQEVRLIVEGAAVYEVRARDDSWLRLSVRAGELVVLPTQRYHRFLVDGPSVKYQSLFRELNALMPFYRASNDETRTV
jgi:1,2-dihydroxy-3-keto-5-methylthiopentene dioxygenase